jgi:hypothetical protein
MTADQRIHIKLKVIVVLVVLLFACNGVHADGLSGWFSVNQSNGEDKEDGDKVGSSDTFQNNMYLNFNRSVTPMLSYQFTLRTNYRDAETTNEIDETTTTYNSSVEPTFDLSLSNPMYDITLGYQRREQWDTAHWRDDSRETDIFYYARFGLTPANLPSLTFDIDREESFDHLSESQLDNTSDSYRIGSAYQLPSQDLAFSYNLDFTHTENEDEISIVKKIESDNFSANYNIGYSGSFWYRRAIYNVNYRGNYSRNKNKRFVTQTGDFLVERSPVDGLYALSTDVLEKEVDGALSSLGALVNDNTVSPAGTIDLSIPNQFHNIGIWVAPDRSVDRLFIYVNKDVTGAGDLNTVSDWTVQRSNSNATGTWNNVSISSVTVTLFDAVNTIYRYEIEFSSSQNASFFRAVNQTDTTTPNVEVTEIEAYGTDTAVSDEFTDVTTGFTQGLSLNTTVTPFAALSFAFNYSLDRRDTDPVSVPDSMEGLIENVFSNTISGNKTNFRSDVTRNYGATATWLTHRMLTTVARFQRSENFDNLDETDFDTNSYGLSFQASPLPTLNASLTLTRSDQYIFNDKDSTNDTIVLSFDTKLYKGVNMVNDFGYTQSESFESDTETDSHFASGTIDATITRRMTGTLTYRYNRSSSEGGTSTLKEALMILNYNPGRFVNITGRSGISRLEGEETTIQAIGIDWLPVPVVRLNFNYAHRESDTDDSKSDTISSSATWYVKKFIDIRTTYNYSVQEQDTKRKNYNLSTTLNCRF